MSIPPTDNAAPAPASALAPRPKWRISPTHIRSTNCTCMKPRHSFTTAPEYIDYQIDRFDKVWTRIIHMNCYPMVLQAVESVVRQVRSEGIELSHFAGYETNSEKYKRVFSVLLLVPDMTDEKIGHRWIAEIMVHVRRDAKDFLNVATRFATDWEDWIICRPAEYVSPISNSESQEQGDEEQAVDLNIPDKRSGVSWEMMMDRLELEVKSLSFGAIMSSQAFRFVITRATKELARDGQKVAGFQVQRVCRIASNSKQSGYSRKTLVPSIRIAFKVLAHGKGRGAVYEEEAAAVASIDLPSATSVERKEGQFQSQTRFEGISVVYKGEWPICHHYRQSIPPPDISTLISVISE